jgi:hypothetical protein
MKTENDICDDLNRRESIAICVECGVQFEQDTDLQLCAECSDLFLLDDLWEAHDNNILDALDFNESAETRERFRIK